MSVLMVNIKIIIRLNDALVDASKTVKDIRLGKQLLKLRFVSVNHCLCIFLAFDRTQMIVMVTVLGLFFDNIIRLFLFLEDFIFNVLLLLKIRKVTC
jgi:hypothetical protein